MPQKQRFWILLVVLLVGAAACGGTAPTEAPADSPPVAATVAVLPTPTVEELAAPPPEPTVDEAAAGAAAAIPGRPSAPASPDEYRADPGTLVGATGNPQLVEFFTFW